MILTTRQKFNHEEETGSIEGTDKWTVIFMSEMRHHVVSCVPDMTSIFPVDLKGSQICNLLWIFIKAQKGIKFQVNVFLIRREFGENKSTFNPLQTTINSFFFTKACKIILRNQTYKISTILGLYQGYLYDLILV